MTMRPAHVGRPPWLPGPSFTGSMGTRALNPDKSCYRDEMIAAPRPMNGPHHFQGRENHATPVTPPV